MGSARRWEDGDSRRVWNFLRAHERAGGERRRSRGNATDCGDADAIQRERVRKCRRPGIAISHVDDFDSESRDLAVRAAVACRRAKRSGQEHCGHVGVRGIEGNAFDVAARTEPASAGEPGAESVSAGAVHPGFRLQLGPGYRPAERCGRSVGRAAKRAYVLWSARAVCASDVTGRAAVGSGGESVCGVRK